MPDIAVSNLTLSVPPAQLAEKDRRQRCSSVDRRRRCQQRNQTISLDKDKDLVLLSMAATMGLCQLTTHIICRCRYQPHREGSCRNLLRSIRMGLLRCE
ncbi:MAG: hypothetical protein MZU97_24355 [Bacillus subtilis]|nr:hypothetical protein [Bacillus subtilis]